MTARFAAIALACTVAACTVAACGGREPVPRASAAQLLAAVPTLSKGVLTGPPKGCDEAPRITRPFDAFVVTGVQCLSCMDVGYASRRVARDARTRKTAFVIVAPVGDSATVCRALRRERTAGSVMLLPDIAVPWRDKRAPLLYIRVPGPESERTQAFVAGDGVSLIDSISAADLADAVSLRAPGTR